MKRTMTDEQRQHKAEYMRAYIRGYKPKPKAKTVGYGREPGKRADRFVDRDKRLPPELVILHDWSWWDVLLEVQRLGRRIQEIRMTKGLKQ